MTQEETSIVTRYQQEERQGEDGECEVCGESLPEDEACGDPEKGEYLCPDCYGQVLSEVETSTQLGV